MPARLALWFALGLVLAGPDASRAEVEHLCIEAREQGCLAICVPGSRVSVAAALLEESRVKVSALIERTSCAMSRAVKQHKNAAQTSTTMPYEDTPLEKREFCM